MLAQTRACCRRLADSRRRATPSYLRRFPARLESSAHSRYKGTMADANERNITDPWIPHNGGSVDPMGPGASCAADRC